MPGLAGDQFRVPRTTKACVGDDRTHQTSCVPGANSLGTGAAAIVNRATAYQCCARWGVGSMTGLAELELARIRWADFRQINGEASAIQLALERLLSATTTEDVEAAYWGLENFVVVQGITYSSAEPTIAVLMASFVDSRITQIKIASLDLMFQALTGWAHPDELLAGNANLIEHCRDRVREGLWLLVREALAGGVTSNIALDVIELVDPARAEQVRVWLSK